MNENDNFNEDYKNVGNFVESEIKNINLIQKIIKTFHKDISILKDDILSIPNIQNGPFFFLNHLLKNFIIELKNNLSELNDFIIPLDNLKNSIISSKEQYLNLIKEIESNLSNSRNDFINKKNEYLNCIKELENKEKVVNNNKENNINNKKISSKKDENIINSSIKENYNQLYQYEKKKMEEIIEENRVKYNNIFKDINTLSTSLKLSIKDNLIKFTKIINNFADIFHNFSKDLKKNIDLIKLPNTDLRKFCFFI